LNLFQDLGRGMKGRSRVGDLKHCKKLCKCYNVSPTSTTIKKKIKVHRLASFYWEKKEGEDLNS
jgi:hypothetical protein